MEGVERSRRIGRYLTGALESLKGGQEKKENRPFEIRFIPLVRGIEPTSSSNPCSCLYSTIRCAALGGYWDSVLFSVRLMLARCSLKFL